MAFRLISPKIGINTLIQRCFLHQNKLVNRSIHLTASNWKRVAFNLSDIGEGIREVVVKEWFVKEGDVVEQFDNLCEVQSDKASVTITSRFDGKILKIYHNVDDTALVGKPLVEFDVKDESASDSEVQNNQEITEEKVHSEEKKENVLSHNKILTTPAVRRIAGENNVDLSEVKATGPNGRILKSDVLEYLNIIPPSKTATEKPITQSSATQQAHTVVADRVEKLKDVRKVMFKSMTASLKIPHFTYCDEVNITDLVKLRESLKKDAECMGVKLTYMPFFIKAASLALTKYPILNSSLDEENESIIYKSSHNISIAMATQGWIFQ